MGSRQPQPSKYCQQCLFPVRNSQYSLIPCLTRRDMLCFVSSKHIKCHLSVSMQHFMAMNRVLTRRVYPALHDDCIDEFTHWSSDWPERFSVLGQHVSKNISQIPCYYFIRRFRLAKVVYFCFCIYSPPWEVCAHWVYFLKCWIELVTMELLCIKMIFSTGVFV